MRDLAVKDFTHDVQLRIFAFDGGDPARPKRAGDVLEGILTNRVNSGDADPPQSILSDITRDLRIVLIQVRQDVDEPTLERLALDLISRVGIPHGPRLPNIRQVMILRAIEPGRRGRVVNPRLIRTRMVRDLVLDP